MKTMRDAAAPVLRRWRRQKVITLTQLCQGLQASVRTVRRRLQAWQALASFNHNSRFYTLPELPRFVYFAAEAAVAAGQKAARRVALPPTPLPSAAAAIAILVLAIQHPQCSPQELCARLRPTHPQLTPAAIGALFAHHGLTLKKTPPPTGSTA